MDDLADKITKQAISKHLERIDPMLVQEFVNHYAAQGTVEHSTLHSEVFIRVEETLLALRKMLGNKQ